MTTKVQLTKLNRAVIRQLRGQLSDQLNDQLRGQLRGQLSDQLRDQLSDQLSEVFADELAEHQENLKQVAAVDAKKARRQAKKLLLLIG